MPLNNVVWRKWRGGGGQGGLEKVLFAEKGFSSLIGGLKYFRERWVVTLKVTMT